MGLGVLALAACGGDDDDASAASSSTASTSSSAPASTVAGTPDEYAAAIAEAIRADAGFSSVPVEDAQCAARGVVDAVGPGTLQRLGLSPQQIRDEQRLPPLEANLDEAQAVAVTDVLLRCLDFGQVLADQIEAGSGTAVTDDQVACMNDRVENNADVRASLARTYTRGAPPPPGDDVDILAIASACLPVEGTTTT